MHVDFKFGRHYFEQFRFHFVDVFARRKIHPVADTENMRIHRYGRPA